MYWDALTAAGLLIAVVMTIALACLSRLAQD